ncbi:MAG: S41 family peptidase [Planctomycetota bacterium]
MSRGIGATTYLLGILSGVLLALIAAELWPIGGGRDIDQYQTVRDFARESFVREVGDDELLDLALHGMLAGLDEYSRFYDAEEATALARQTYGRYRGVGIIFRRPIAEGRVLYPLPDSPAMRAGVRVGDQFLEVSGTSVEELGDAGLRAALAEPTQDALKVRVQGLDGSVRDLEIQPDSVIDPSVRHVRILDEERGIGYLAIVSFSSETDREFDAAFDFLKKRGMRALVIDLRHNLGGVLESAVRVAARFVQQGVIVSTEGRGEPVVYRAEEGSAWYLGTPLAVLVDGSSASASEVLAGALQDHRAAVLVGEPTYGKGMVQTIRHFDTWGTRAKVTSSYYYSPTHRNFERTADPDRDHGILPDLEIPLLRQERGPLYSFLGGYSPGPEVIPALEAWEEAEGLTLIEPLPRDAQLEAALALFAGERPGPQRVGPEQPER